MKVFYFCAQTIVQHICRVMGKGKVRTTATVRNHSVSGALVSVLLCHLSVIHAYGGDSLVIKSDRFDAKQLIVPSALIAVGSFGVSNGWLCSVKQDVKQGFQYLRGDCRFKADDYLQYMPVAANVALGWTGAGIGILSARIGYWLLPWERKLFGWDRASASVAVIPTYQPETKTLGLGLTAHF